MHAVMEIKEIGQKSIKTLLTKSFILNYFRSATGGDWNDF